MKFFQILAIMFFISSNCYSEILSDDWAYFEEIYDGVTNITDVEDWGERTWGERCTIATIVYYNAIEYITEQVELYGPEHIHNSHITGPERDMNRFCSKTVRCGRSCVEQQILNGTLDL